MITLAYRLTLKTFEQCQPWLTSSELQYCQTLHPKRQAEFSNGRAIVRQLLLQSGNLTLTDILIDLPSERAPTLRVQQQPMHLSLTHSGTAIAVAISEQPIGLDIERIKPRDIRALTEQFPALAGTTTQQQFYQRWTYCEAYSKCTGDNIWRVLQRPLPNEIPLYYLPFPDYMLCLCYLESSQVIQNIGELQ